MSKNMRKTLQTQPKNDFGIWLLDNMIRRELSCSDLAVELNTTRQTIRNRISGDIIPSYVWVVAYCYIFDDSPAVVWQMV